MAITIAHNVAGLIRGAPPLGVHLCFKELHDYMAAQPRFTIVDSKNIGLSGGWFVFELAGGTGWQCWLGVRATTSDWDSSNASDSILNHRFYAAFAPKGGWAIGADDPNATMFSLCPSEGGGPQGQFWLRIRNFCSSGNNYYESSTIPLQFTIWDDPNEGFFCILVDSKSENRWDAIPGSFGIFPLDSRFGDLDSAPYVVLCGEAPKVGTTGWLSTSTTNAASSHLSAMLLPGDSGSPPTVCFPTADPLRVFDHTTQPDPLTGEYDLDVISIYTKTPNRGHSRGFIHRDYMRQGLLTDSARRIFGDGRWIVPIEDAQILLPWDKTIKL